MLDQGWAGQLPQGRVQTGCSVTVQPLIPSPGPVPPRGCSGDSFIPQEPAPGQGMEGTGLFRGCPFLQRILGSWSFETYLFPPRPTALIQPSVHQTRLALHAEELELASSKEASL